MKRLLSAITGAAIAMTLASCSSGSDAAAPTTPATVTVTVTAAPKLAFPPPLSLATICSRIHTILMEDSRPDDFPSRAQYIDIASRLTQMIDSADVSAKPLLIALAGGANQWALALDSPSIGVRLRASAAYDRALGLRNRTC